MGVQRKRRRREERLEEEEQELERDPAEKAVQEKEREREESPTDRVLELQKTAGNRATTAAISRWGFPFTPATAAPQWPKEPQVSVDGKVIPLQSWSWSDQQRGTGGGGVGPGAVQFNDVSVQTEPGDHSADLAQKAATGEHIKKVVIVMPGKDGKGITFTFYDVLITSYSYSGNGESWSMSFAKKELTQAPPQAQPRG